VFGGGVSGAVRAGWNSRAKGLAAGKSVLPRTPSAHDRINHPAERKRGSRRTRGDVPPSLTQWRRSGGGLGGVARRRSVAYTPVRANYGSRGRAVFRRTTSSCRPVDRAQHVRSTTDPARVLIVYYYYLRRHNNNITTRYHNINIIKSSVHRRGPLHARCCACNDVDIRPSSHAITILLQCTYLVVSRNPFEIQLADFLVGPR